MRKAWAWLVDKLKKLWRWLRVHAFNKEMFLWFLIAEIIFWSPCIVTGFLGIFVNEWWWSAFGSIVAFWAGPFTPAVPLQLGLAAALKKLDTTCRKRRAMKRCSKE